MKKTLLVLVLLVFATSVFAADWGLWGSLRFKTFWVSQDSDRAERGDSDTDLREFGLQDNARVGARVKVNENFSVNLELAVRGASYSNAVVTRQFYGTYDFGPAKIHIGQMYTITSVLPFDQVTKDDGDLLGFGALYTGRQETIMLEASGFRFAIVRPGHFQKDDFNDYDFNLPRLEADYTLKVDPVSARFFGAFQTVQEDAPGTYDMNSFVVGAEVSGRMGIVGFAATGYYGSNLAVMGAAGENKLMPSDDEDTSDCGGAAAIMLYPNDKIKVEVGAGYTRSDRDDVSKANEQMSVYANIKYDIAQGFFIQPEVSYYDYMDDETGRDEGSEVYFGAKWQMDF